ncbi:hypothetical protein ABBQ32_002041 [Trebouxia sp. C0010 RCD-2024]
MRIAVAAHGVLDMTSGRSASQVQQGNVEVIWGRIVAVANDVEDAVVDLDQFQNLLNDAFSAGVFDVWPFKGSNAACSNVTTAKYYLPDQIYAADSIQKLNAVFPYLDLLFSCASASCCQPKGMPMHT